MRIYLLLFAFILQTNIAIAHNGQDDVICDESNTTIEIAECVSSHFDKAEQRRLEMEVAEFDRAQNLEQDFKEMGSVQYQSFASQTEKSRSSFEAYRKEECMRVRLSYGAGTMASIGYISCKLNLTEQRIEQLRNE